MARAKAPKWKPADYTPFYLEEEPIHSEREIRAEYTRIRDITMKRAARLEAAGLEDYAGVLRASMPKLSQVGSVVEEINRKNAERRKPKPEMTVSSFIRNALSAGHAALDNQTLSLSGIKDIQKRFYDETGEEIGLGDVLSFNDYMASWRTSAFSALVAASDAKDYYAADYQDVGGDFATFWAVVHPV